MITSIGKFAIESFAGTIGLLFLFCETFVGIVGQALQFRLRFREIISQTHAIAVESLSIIVVSIVFISLMLVLEFSYHMKLVLRHDSLVPAFSTVLMLRELGPVMACLILGSRVGAGIAAEVGTMRVTDQIDALKLLSIDPIEYLVVPRFKESIVTGKQQNKTSQIGRAHV